MKTKRERDALKALLDLKESPARVVRASRRRSLGYVGTGIVALTGLAMWNKYLNDAAYIILSFSAGILLALGYCKYIESVGIRFIEPYLRWDDISARHKRLVR